MGYRQPSRFPVDVQFRAGSAQLTSWALKNLNASCSWRTTQGACGSDQAVLGGSLLRGAGSGAVGPGHSRDDRADLCGDGAKRPRSPGCHSSTDEHAWAFSEWYSKWPFHKVCDM